MPVISDLRSPPDEIVELTGGQIKKPKLLDASLLPGPVLANCTAARTAEETKASKSDDPLFPVHPLSHGAGSAQPRDVRVPDKMTRVGSRCHGLLATGE
jgi:hypothetical protein